MLKESLGNDQFLTVIVMSADNVTVTDEVCMVLRERLYIVEENFFGDR
jgi:hypothetical protein